MYIPFLYLFISSLASLALPCPVNFLVYFPWSSFLSLSSFPLCLFLYLHTSTFSCLPPPLLIYFLPESSFSLFSSNFPSFPLFFPCIHRACFLLPAFYLFPYLSFLPCLLSLVINSFFPLLVIFPDLLPLFSPFCST